MNVFCLNQYNVKIETEMLYTNRSFEIRPNYFVHFEMWEAKNLNKDV